MSMNGHFVEITPRLLRHLQREPSLAEAVVYLEFSDPGLGADDDIDFFMKSWSPARQQYMRAVLSADVDAIGAALKKLVPRKQWQIMMSHISGMTKEQLSKEAAERRKTLIQYARQVKPVLSSAMREKAGRRPIPHDDLGERLCIDKAWDGLDYLLCSAMDTRRGPGSFKESAR